MGWEVEIVVLMGSFVNAAAIILGTILGVLVPVPVRIRETIVHALSLALIVIGVSMGLKTENILIPVIALALGSAAGEFLNIEGGIARLGAVLEQHFGQKAARGNSPNFVQGFLTATLIYCVGAMAVVGGLNSGLQLNHQVLYAKSLIDGITAIFFTASLGIGVGFSALPVFLYQGGIALLAAFVAPILSGPVLSELTAVGGMLIIGISINVMGLAKLAVGNMLPAILFAILLSLIF